MNGQIYGQSLAIASFFAKRFGYYGKTDLDGLRIQEVMQMVEDERLTLRSWVLEKDPTLKAEKAKAFTDVTFPKYLRIFEQMLTENGSTGYFVNDKVSLADIFAYDFGDTMKSMDPRIIDKYPNLAKQRKIIEAIPSIKKYVDSRVASPI